jgi:peptide deformylase
VAVRRIVMLGEPVLRQKAKKIHHFDASTQRLVDDLMDTLGEAHGVGLAAPQIGVPLRAFVSNVEDKWRVLINPEIIAASDDQIEADEGCLSIPGWWGPVKRHAKVTVRALNQKGKPIKVKAEELEARCFQHEIDHLDGVLFVDRMEDRGKLYRVEPGAAHEEDGEPEEDAAEISA